MTGLVVEDNTAENPFNSSNGAGVYAYWASVVIRDTIIRNNHFDVTKGWTAGGGLYMNVGDIELEDVQIEDNVGEVYIDGESVELTRVEIRGSDCSDYGAGTPQLSISCEDLEIADSVIENSTTCAGLTMWCDTMCTVRNSVIQYNEGGSGIAMECPFNVSNTAIIGNVAENGGGIHYSCNYMLTEPMSLSNLLIAQNHATYAGGGIYCWGNSSLAEITNVVIAENTAGQFGGGVRESAGSSTTEFTNCVVVGNSAGTDGGGFYAEKPPNSIHVSTDTWDNQPGNFSQYYPDPTGSDGNLSEDPQFLDRSDPDPMQWDLHLALGSPLIDGGGGSGSDPDFGTPDIGIYGGWNAEAWDLDFDGYDDWWMPGPYDFKTYPGLGWDCDDRDPDVYPGNGC